MIAFFMPIFTAVAELKRVGGSALGYIVIVPSAIVVGGVIVYTEWRVGRTIWRRLEKHSKTVQNAVGASLFGLLLLGILVGLISGHKLALFVANHVAH